MYNLNFTTFAEACKINDMTEAEMVVELKRHLDNQNYRTNYNKRKNALNTLLRNDPVVQERAKALLQKKAK